MKIDKVSEALKRGETILYPTDTIWGIGCDATNEEAVENVFKIKNRPDNKSMILLIDSLEHLSKYVEKVPLHLEEYLSTSLKPTTVIYQYKSGLTKPLIATDNTVAFRICNDFFCVELIKALGKPIVSTSANLSGESSPTCFDEISKELKSRVDYIVEHKQLARLKTPSRIIKIEDGKEIKVIRE